MDAFTEVRGTRSCQNIHNEPLRSQPIDNKTQTHCQTQESHVQSHRHNEGRNERTGKIQAED